MLQYYEMHNTKMKFYEISLSLCCELREFVMFYVWKNKIFIEIKHRE